MKTVIVLLPLLVVSYCQDANTYWGSYDLTIPGGSGAGNAVQNLALPNNAPDFFKFANFDRQQPVQPARPVQQVKQFIPQHGQQFKPAQQFRPAPAPQPAPQQQFRPAPQSTQQFRPAPQPTQQFRPAPQQTPTARLQSQFTIQTIVGSSQQQGTQGLRVFEPEPSTPREPEPQSTQQFRPAPQPTQQFRPAPQPTQQFRTAPQPTQQFRPAPQPTQQFRPAPQPAPRPTQQFRPASGPARPASRDYMHDSTGDNELSRYQQYILRKKGKLPQTIQPKLQQPVSNEVATSEVPSRRKVAVRRKKLRNKA